MGAYKCQFGVTHKMCRCPKPHTIRCNVPSEHNPDIKAETHICLVMQNKLDGKSAPFGKHEAHEPHVWWYTSWGGGHQVNEISDPEKDWDDTEKWVKRWYCPGRDADA